MSKRKSRNYMFLVTRVVGLLVLTIPMPAMGQSGSSSATDYTSPPTTAPPRRPRQAQRYPWNPGEMESMPDKFRLGIANLITLESALFDFHVFEARFPRSLDELLDSDEMPVVRQDLINPYTGKPVKSVVTKSLGDVRYVHDPDSLNTPDVHIEVFLDPAGDGSRVEKYSWLPNYWIARGSLDKFRLEYAGEDTRTGADRRMWFICRAVSNAINRVNYWYDRTPLTFEETMRKYDWWLSANLKNPYTGAPIHEVFSPSPGDFTFAGVIDVANPLAGYVGNYIICYDSGGQPMFYHSSVETEIANEMEIQARVPEIRYMDKFPSGVSFKKKAK